ncbi:host specificity factor TipJ family phage tail protein [Pectobacterium parmentieri]|uniref:host specificity factor TipJ family phage tail protein n=1 Tax=Pectobacterium parmentieri TaxID=1905730 RepID=UPI000F8E528A|nr:host specificity factor TipJ family phage tail protein [Pectobacterium parmentieri]AZS56815.1 phage tail protein [Pectobacterium parmentieri]MBI0429661.1 MoaD/ThiS family protein [Pectobacterium parmentieri]
MPRYEIQRLPGAPKEKGVAEVGTRIIDVLEKSRLHNSVIIKLNGNQIDDDFDITQRLKKDDVLTIFDQPQGGIGSFIKDAIKLSAPWEALNPIRLTKKGWSAIQKLMVGDMKNPNISIATGESPNNDLTGQSNTARLYKGRPNVYGQQRVFPDLIQESLFEYIDNKKYVTEFMEVGYGQYTISSVRYSESSLGSMAGASYHIYQPGEVIGTINEGYAFDDVDGQELPGLNEATGAILNEAETADVIEAFYAGGQISVKILKQEDFDYFHDRTKPLSVTFVVNVTYDTASGTVTKNISVVGDILSSSISDDGAIIDPEEYYTFIFGNMSGSDITSTPIDATINAIKLKITEFEGGVIGPFFAAVDSEYLWFHLAGNQAANRSGPVTISYWAVDDDNNIIPGTDQTLNVDVRNNRGEQDYVYFTFKVKPDAGKRRYAFQLKRTDNSANDSTLYIQAAHSINIRENVVYPNDTMVRVTVAETENASSVRERKYNMLATRHTISYDSNTQQIDYTLRASRSFADSVLHEWVVIAKQDPNRLDLPALYDIADSLSEPQLGYFDYTFSDAGQALGERIQIICNAARVDINWIGDTLTFWRDEKESYPVAVFGRSNMFWDEFKMGYSMSMPNGYDGIALDYTDPRTNNKAYIYLSVDTNGIIEVTTAKPSAMTITLAGCRNKAQAENRAWLEARKLLYSRSSMTVKVFETTQVVRGSVVQCPDMYDNEQQTGYLTGRDGGTFFTSERINFPGDMWVVITDSEGGYRGRYRAYSVTNNTKAFSCDAEAFDLNIYDGKRVQTPSRYFISSADELNATLWRVESATPNGDDTQTLSLSEYSDEIYTDD